MNKISYYFTMKLDADHDKEGLSIPAEIIEATHMSREELKQEIALMLFQKGKLTLGQASKLAGMGQFQFQHLCATRKIPIHYDSEGFEEDLKTLERMEQP